MTTMATTSLPEPIVTALRRLIRRARWLLVARGLCAVAAVGVGALLAVMAVDSVVTIFSAAIRGALSGGAGALTGLAGYVWLVRPLARSFTYTGMARMIEARHPEMHERISSAIGLLASRDGPELRGSQQLIAELVREACDNAGGVCPSRELHARWLRPWAMAAGAVVATLAVLWAIWPQRVGVLAARVVAPFDERLGNVQSADLRVEPGDMTIPVGERARLAVAVAHAGVTKAQVRRVDAAGVETAEGMVLQSRGEGGPVRFVYTTAPLAESFRYRIHAGDALSGYYHVRVLPRPVEQKLDVACDYPPYTGLARRLDQGSAGDIAAPAGSTVTVEATFNRPLAYAALKVGQRALDAQSIQAVPGGSLCRWRWTLMPDPAVTHWSIVARDQEGIENVPVEHGLTVATDQAPSVRLLSPQSATVRLKPTDSLPLGFEAQDDLGLAQAHLLVSVDGKAQTPVPVELPGRAQGLPDVRLGTARLDLSQLNLSGATRLTVQVRVRDGLPADQKGPQSAVSETREVVLDSGAAAYAVQAVLAEELQVRTALDAAIKALREAQERSANLDKLVSRKEALSPAILERVTAMRDRLAAADASCRLASARSAGSAFEPLGPRIAEVADQNIAVARGSAERLGLLEEPAARAKEAQEAHYQIGRAIERLTGLSAELAQAGKLMATAGRLGELSAQQDKLVEAARHGDPAGREQRREAQRQLTGDLAQMVRETPQALARQADKQARQARDLVSEADALVRSQQQAALLAQTMDQAREISEQLAALSNQQRELAREAAAEKLSADQGPAMEQAARDLAEDRLDQAVARQQSAENNLHALAEQLSREQMSAQVAQAASRLAQTQAELAREAKAQHDRGAASQQAAAREEVKVRSAQQVVEALDREIRKQTQNLLPRQQDLVAAAQALERSADSQARKGVDPLPSEAMAQAVKQLQGGNVPKASQAATMAARQVKQLADQMARSSPSTQPAASQPVDQARRLVASQEALAQEVTKAADLAASRIQADRQARAAQAQRQTHAREAQQALKNLADMSKAQQALAQQAEALARQASQATKVSQAAAAVGPYTQAAEQTRKQMQTGQTPQAVEAAQAAAEAARKLADALTQAAEGSRGPQASRMGELARRQQTLREQVQRLGALRSRQSDSLAAGKVTEALAGQQGAVARGAQSLSQATELISQHARELLPDEATRRAADAAAQHGAQASQSAARAAGQLAQARAGASLAEPRKSQQQALQGFQQTGKDLQELGRRLAEAAARNPQAPEPPVSPDDLAAAFEAAQAAADTEALSSAEVAAKLLASLSAAAAGKARQMGLDPAQAAEASIPGLGTSAQGASAMPADVFAAQLKALGIDLADWTRLNGELRSEILQAAGQEGPPEYRELIKRYFQALSRRAAHPAAVEPHP